MYAISWLAIIFWTPEAIYSRLIKDTLFGTLHGSLYVDNFPLIPWIGFYLTASCIGQKLGEFYNNNELRKSLNLIAGSAVIMLVSMLIIKLSAKGLALIEIFSKGSNVYEMTAHLYLKLPPGMCYFLFYGGIGLSWWGRPWVRAWPC